MQLLPVVKQVNCQTFPESNEPQENIPFTVAEQFDKSKRRFLDYHKVTRNRKTKQKQIRWRKKIDENRSVRARNFWGFGQRVAVRMSPMWSSSVYRGVVCLGFSSMVVTDRTAASKRNAPLYGDTSETANKCVGYDPATGPKTRKTRRKGKGMRQICVSRTCKEANAFKFQSKESRGSSLQGFNYLLAAPKSR